ncbi:ABC-type transport auxiliary lipoprotein family protein [Paracidovorax sp. MALMAid1276]|uniref:ABC-type transport auxiliary lipoprotein family protein n=1 Tax=Paracidovorax sp. MALMAid1276 TaxID=3411631 RepID=UPI003B9B653F
MKFSALAAVLAPVLMACSALPQPPTRPALYDFGPGLHTPAPAAAPAPGAAAAPRPPLTLDDIEAPGLTEGSNAVLYRLAYNGPQQLRPYSLARWSQPPAQLLQQRLREQLGQRRAILRPDYGSAQARSTDQGGRLPPVLRIELEEFSHHFASATDSAGVVRVRATLVDVLPQGESLRGQRVFVARVPARTADAPGGVAALAEASTQVGAEIDAWLDQLAPAPALQR